MNEQPMTLADRVEQAGQADQDAAIHWSIECYAVARNIHRIVRTVEEAVR